ncbi:MAG: hypothetical protein GAK43_00762 [Stenotrophomonas maltophilia]|nr:MAG: hypothetical protein GAK43_00762 [Stenotrophomonas maltophilia]
MPRGSKAKYTEQQKHKAEFIEQRYEAKGLSKKTAEARAWATVNKQSGGGERSGGSGRDTPPAQKRAARQDSARRAVATKHGVPRRQSDFASMTREELLAKARQRNVRGRSRMRKAELIQALSTAS